MYVYVCIHIEEEGDLKDGLHLDIQKEVERVDVLLRQPTRRGLVFKAHRRVCHSALGLRVMKKKKRP